MMCRTRPVKLRNLERTAPKHALAEIRDDFHRITYAGNADAARAAYAAFERAWAKRFRCRDQLAGRRQRTPYVLQLPQGAVEDVAHHERHREAPRRIPAARKDAGRTTDRRCGVNPALQPRGERPDQVARDRRLAEDRRGAKPAHGGGGMMIIRAALAVALALGVLADPLAAEAQQAGKMWRIGYLQTPPASTTPIRDAFRQGLSDLGYVEGRNLVIEFRDAGAKPERLAALASELVRLKVDVIVATGTQAISAAKQATSVIPIVMTVSGDAVGTGLVASLARPSGNVTGLTLITPESAGKRLELLKEAFPKTSRIAVLWNPTDPPRLLEYKQTQDAAKLLGLMLQSVEVRSSEELEG